MQNDWADTWNSVFCCFDLWELPARRPRRLHFKPAAPQKSDHETQRKPQNLTQMVFQQLGAVLGPMFSIVHSSFAPRHCCSHLPKDLLEAELKHWSANIISLNVELWAWIDHTLVAITLKCQKHWSHKANRLLYKEAALFTRKAPLFF